MDPVGRGAKNTTLILGSPFLGKSTRGPDSFTERKGMIQRTPSWTDHASFIREWKP